MLEIDVSMSAIGTVFIPTYYIIGLSPNSIDQELSTTFESLYS